MKTPKCNEPDSGFKHHSVLLSESATWVALLGRCPIQMLVLVEMDFLF